MPNNFMAEGTRIILTMVASTRMAMPKAEAHLLQADQVTGGKSPEHSHHDQGRPGDEASRGPNAKGHGLCVVVGLVVMFPDAA